MRRFFIALSLGFLSMFPGECFCLKDSTYIRHLDNDTYVWGRHIISTNGKDTTEYRSESFGTIEGSVPFWADEPTPRKVCTICIPREEQLQFSFLNGSCICSLSTKGDKLIYTFLVENLEPFVAEPDMADTIAVAPKLVVSRQLKNETPQDTTKSPFSIVAKNILEENGTMVGVMTITAKGYQMGYFDDIFQNNSKDEWKSIFEELILRISPKARLAGLDFGRDPRNFPDGQGKIIIKYRIPEYALQGDRELSFKPVTLNGFLDELLSFTRMDTSLETRKYKFKDLCPRCVDIVETITVPKGYLLAGGSRRANIPGAVASFSGGVSQSYAGLEIREKLLLGKRIYDPSDWGEVKRAIEAYKSNSEWITIVK